MPAKVLSCSIKGLNCEVVTIEANVLNGISSFSLVGLGDTAVHEAKERVFSAIKNSGFHFPPGKKIVNLAPADLKKHGPSFDLAIAISLLKASKQIDDKDLNDSLFIGELSLEGRLNSVKGVLPISDFAKRKGIKQLFVPYINAVEAALIEGVDVYPVICLKELCSHIMGIKCIPKYENSNDFFRNSESKKYNFELNEICGNEHAKRALIICASGGHNLLFTGSPGGGKTILARSISSVLNNLDIKESLEVSKIYSVAGLLPKDKPLIIERPFRIIHHSASMVSIIGGGNDISPGEISLAHRGVLFFDELLEFPKYILESLRQPIEDGEIAISRASGKVVYPSKFIFIGAMNPCPCGYFGDIEKECICSESQVIRYQKKLSGPFLDRIDLFVDIPRIKFEKLIANNSESQSRDYKNNVQKARNIQKERFKNEKIFTNSEMSSPQVKKFCNPDNSSLKLLKDAVKNLNLSARGYFRVLKVARTIADLNGQEQISFQDIAEALQYRNVGYNFKSFS